MLTPVVLRKLAVGHFHMQRLASWPATAVTTTELLSAYRQFRANGQSGSPRQPFKGWDLWRILEKAKPKKIVELGSGTTSAVFALWASWNRAQYFGLEHSRQWADVTNSVIKELGPYRVSVAETFQVDGANGFAVELPPDADFVYVDGPPCLFVNGKKRPNTDVYRLLEVGGLPKTIVVDGRIDTVDLIRSHRIASKYDFSPSFAYAVERGLSPLPYREHSVFTSRGY